MIARSKAPWPPTPRQRDVLDFIRSYVAGHGYAPTVREIAAGIGTKYHNNAYQFVNELVRRGLIEKAPRMARAIRVVESAGASR